jgi:hypothetical protein
MGAGTNRETTMNKTTSNFAYKLWMLTETPEHPSCPEMLREAFTMAKTVAASALEDGQNGRWVSAQSQCTDIVELLGRARQLAVLVAGEWPAALIDRSLVRYVSRAYPLIGNDAWTRNPEQGIEALTEIARRVQQDLAMA